MSDPRYFVQSEQVRGEPRFYWVADRLAPNDSDQVSRSTTSKRTAERQCEQMNTSESRRKE